MIVKTTSQQTTLGINAAFLQEVKESNVQLWSTLRELRTHVLEDCEPSYVARRFVELLGELRDCLAFEFSLEETYGFVSGIPARAASGNGALKARAQHSELYLHLHELCEQVEEAQYRGTIRRDLASYFDAFSYFDECLAAHEALESELIEDGLGVRRKPK